MPTTNEINHIDVHNLRPFDDTSDAMPDLETGQSADSLYHWRRWTLEHEGEWHGAFRSRKGALDAARLEVGHYAPAETIRPMSHQPKGDPRPEHDWMAMARTVARGMTTPDAWETQKMAAWLLSVIDERDEAIEALKQGRLEALKDPAAQKRVMERLVGDIRDGDFTMSEVLDSIFPPEMP